MTATSAAEIAYALGGKRSGTGWVAKCPAHDDSKPSLSITESGDGSVLVYCHAGCPQEEVIKALKSRGLWPKPASEEGHVAEYNYTDKNGKLLYQIVRKTGKRFPQRYPNGKDGWVWKKYPQQVLYHLPAVLNAECVLVVEGEKDADTLPHRDTILQVLECKLGYKLVVATTNAGGANAPWLPEFTATLAGKIVVLVPDNDPPGWARVLRIARSLVGKVQKVIVRAPGDGAKDISDWFAAQKAERLLLDDPVEISTAADIDALEAKLLGEGKIDAKAAQEQQSTPKQIAAAVEWPKALSVAEVMALKVEPHVELIKNFLPARGASIIFGWEKSNKTLVGVQAAIAIASGKPFLGRYPVLKKGPVLILEADDPDGAAAVQRILKASPIPTEGLPIYTVPKVPFTFGVEFVEGLRRDIIEKKIIFVVLDSYTKLRGSHSKGMDIVKAEANDLTQLDELAKQTNCSILIIHHQSKGSASMQHWSRRSAGTFAMGMSTENQIGIARFSEFVDDAPERLLCVRGRHTAGMQLVLRFRLPTLDQEFVLEIADAELYPLLKTLEAAFHYEPFTPKDMRLETGYSAPTVHTKIHRLLQAKLIHKKGYGEYVLVGETD